MLTRAEMRAIIYEYVMADTHRLEIFTDYEICKSGDYEDCVAELSIILNDMDTPTMKVIVDNILHEDEFDTYEDIFYGERPHKSDKSNDELLKQIDELTERVNELSKKVIIISKTVCSQYM